MFINNGAFFHGFEVHLLCINCNKFAVFLCILRPFVKLGLLRKILPYLATSSRKMVLGACAKLRSQKIGHLATVGM